MRRKIRAAIVLNLLKRGYPEKVTDTEMKKVLGDNNKKINNKAEREILFVVTFLSTEQLVVENVAVNVVKCVIILRNQILLLALSQGKPLRKTWQILVYLLTCNKCKNNTLVKLQTTSVVDGTTTSLKVEVLIEENSVCKNICTKILKVKSFSFLWRRFSNVN